MPIRRILVVDDSPTERLALTELLTREGYQVLTAENGEQALALARAELPDLVLMDVVMPGMNGYQATRHIPVIICTTKGQEADRAWGLRQGAVAYLVKPIDETALLAAIRSME